MKIRQLINHLLDYNMDETIYMKKSDHNIIANIKTVSCFRQIDDEDGHKIIDAIVIEGFEE